MNPVGYGLALLVCSSLASAACFADPIQCQRQDGRCVDSAQDDQDSPSQGDGDATVEPGLVVVGLTVSTDRVDEVRLHWSAVDGASGYHVYRDGVRLTSGAGLNSTTYDDRGAQGPSQEWQAPTSLVASSDDPDFVRLSWEAPERPLGPLAVYKVQAVSHTGLEGPLGDGVGGRRAAPALVRYEVEVTGSDEPPAWVLTAGTETSWVDERPPRAILQVGSVSASQGAHRDFVRVSADGFSLQPPHNVRYRVRGVLADQRFTPTSQAAEGRLAAVELGVVWERSSGAAAEAFEPIPPIAMAFDDAAAPADGDRRWYRMTLSAHGIAPFTSPPVAGWRLSFEAVSVSGSHACALDTDKRVWCWGANTSGELGRGFDSPSPELPGLALLVPSARHVVAGYGRTCFVTESGGLSCVGGDPLGVASPPTSLEPVSLALFGVTSVGLGDTVSCASDESSNTWCWGSGNLGDGSGASSAVPVRVKAQTGYLMGATRVAYAIEHGCALAFQTIRCWGDNGQGQLGVSGLTESGVATHGVPGLAAIGFALGDNRSCAVTTEGKASCWGVTFGGNTPVVIDGVEGAVDMASGLRSFCARLVTGGVRCWGANDYGELGQGTVGGASSLSVPVPELNAVVDIAGGASAFCVVTGGDVLCWGRNAGGVLGDGTIEDRSRPGRIVTP